MERRMTEKIPLVVIVSGGFSGLAAANHSAEAGRAMAAVIDLAKALHARLAAVSIMDAPPAYTAYATAADSLAAKSIFRQVTQKPQLPPFSLLRQWQPCRIQQEFCRATERARHAVRFLRLARLGLDPHAVSGREQLAVQRLLPVGLDVPQCKAGDRLIIEQRTNS
jgi:hypothetical protein